MKTTRWILYGVTGLLLALNAVAQEGGAGTVITSKRMTYDYKRMNAEFSGTVVVTDSQMKIECDEMVVTFAGSNEIKQVTAMGNVRIRQADKTATCNKAVYSAKDGKITLTGRAKVVRLNKDTLAGEEIIFWVNEDRVAVTKGAQLIIAPDPGGGRQGLNLLGPPVEGKKKPASAGGPGQ